DPRATRGTERIAFSGDGHFLPEGTPGKPGLVTRPVPGGNRERGATESRSELLRRTRSSIPRRLVAGTVLEGGAAGSRGTAQQRPQLPVPVLPQATRNPHRARVAGA